LKYIGFYNYIGWKKNTKKTVEKNTLKKQLKVVSQGL